MTFSFSLQHILYDLVPINFDGIVEWLLGTHFLSNVTPNDVDIHLSQSGFSQNLVESSHVANKSPTPTATPYCSGLSINAISETKAKDTSLAQVHHKEAYQSLVGSIGWIAT